MAITLSVQKIGDHLKPLEEIDLQALEHVKQGQGFRVELIRVSSRSIQHHKLYFGGLVKLVADYWDDGEMSLNYDMKVLRGLIKWVAKQGYESKSIENMLFYYVEDRKDELKTYMEYDKAATRISQIHNWLKIEAGYCDTVLTPTGIIKNAQSINFNAMPDQASFDEFYKKVFNVAWKYLFQRKFKTQEEAEKLALEMSQFG